jgi:hypothetical protein
MLGETLDADTGKVAVKCPWHEEHSNDGKPWRPQDSSTVIISPERAGKWPVFRCLHTHGDGRELQTVLEWFEQQEPGIVDAHCARMRVWQEGQTSEDGRPRLMLPGDGCTDSQFAREAGEILSTKRV